MSDDEPRNFDCKVKGCTAPEGGDCKERHPDRSGCPYFTDAEATSSDVNPDDEDDIDQDDDEIEGAGEEPKVVLLPRGASLQPDEAQYITGARPTLLTVVVGAAESGKSTLIASIYERFRQGPFAGIDFAGSATLRGFELICHLGRSASGLESPKTERTYASEGRKLLHLRLRKGEGPKVDLLISDLSGEDFDQARASGEEARRMQIVKAAHRLVFLVDGEKLVRADLRQSAREEATTLLRTFVEEGLVSPRAGVDIIFSKWDLVTPESRNKHEAFADVIWEDIQRRFGTKVASLRRFNVSARHPRGETPPASGLEEAIPGWIAASHKHRYQALPWPMPEVAEFDRYIHCVPGTLHRLPR